MNVAYAIQALAPYVTQLTAVNTATSGNYRGSYTNTASSGILIKRDGTCLVGSIGSTLTITLEGGKAGWDGALENNDVYCYESSAQINALNNIIDYIMSRNNTTSISLDR